MLLSLSEKRPFLWVVILGVMLGVWVPKDGQSGCDPVSLPYFEDFEGTGFHFFSTSYSRAWEGPPQDWKKEGGNKGEQGHSCTGRGRILHQVHFRRNILQHHAGIEELRAGIVYVTKINMKSALSCEVVSDVMFMDLTKGMTIRIQNVHSPRLLKNKDAPSTRPYF